MSVRVTLGEPYWRAARTRELELPLVGGGGLTVPELCALLAVPGLGVGADDAEAPLFVLNGRLLSGTDARQAVVYDGDHVAIQLMLAGG